MTLVSGTLVSIQIVAWITAVLASGSSRTVLALGGVAYVLGLRHGLDADHISVIDNVSRNLIGRGESATATGLLFALGHSAVVSTMALLIGAASSRINGAFVPFREAAAVYSTLISVAVLFIIAPRNAWAAWQIFHTLDRSCGRASVATPNGLVGRLTRPLLQLNVRSWHMLIIGALFGLGFETATAISMMSLTASHFGPGLHLGVPMIYPLLFTAGMTFVDGLDGMFMERAYSWAAVSPKRHARYNLCVTTLAALVATLVGSFELLSALKRVAGPKDAHSSWYVYVEDHFKMIGAGIMALFAIGWIGSVVAAGIRDRGNFKKPEIALCDAVLLIQVQAKGEQSMEAPSIDGLIVLPTQHAVAEILTRIVSIAQARGITVFAKIDFSGDAARSKLTLRPTGLVILGNPAAGTPVMSATPTAAIDLPLKDPLV